MTENEFITWVRKKVAGTLGLPLTIFENVGSANENEGKTLSRINKKIEIVKTRETIKAIYKSNFDIPFKVFFEMDKLGIDMKYLRVCLWCHYIEIDPRLMHLATRHKSPRVRKKNQKRICKLLHGH